MFRLALSAALLAVAFSFPAVKASCGNPDGTDKALHFENCATDRIQVRAVTIKDDQGNVNYPINVHKPMHLILDSFNSGDTVSTDFVNVKLFDYTSNWLTGNKCEWLEIPTLGALNKINGCSFAHDCPILSGALHLEIVVDLSQFQFLINALLGNNTYKLQINMFQNVSNNEGPEVACVVVEVMFNVNKGLVMLAEDVPRTAEVADTRDGQEKLNIPRGPNPRKLTADKPGHVLSGVRDGLNKINSFAGQASDTDNILS